MALPTFGLFDIKKKKEEQYLLLTPGEPSLMGGETQATWELLDEAELDRRVAENELDDSSRLFVVDREIKIHFQKTTHLE
ncbi:MAG: hypothetical protein QNL04_04935 [SAR324 cluster bacterium]|nr:hypothetical protein [SAR324 cluster bacterium]